MAFNVNQFRSTLTGDGARPNLFEVTFNFNNGINILGGDIAGSQMSFMAKASQLPGSSVGTVPMYYFGREVKFAGNRTFADWSVTIINDEDFVIRNAFERWMNGMLKQLTEQPR